jgi:hypothetical protein
MIRGDSSTAIELSRPRPTTRVLNSVRTQTSFVTRDSIADPFLVDCT